jgi:hypothetical protein
VTGGAVVGVDFGTLTVREVTVERVREALSFTGGTLQGAFASVSSDASAGTAAWGVVLEDVATAGAFAFGDGALVARTPWRVSGGGGEFRYDGDLAAELGAGANERGVWVSGMTGGSVELGGAVAVAPASGATLHGGSVGLLVENQAGGARVRFGGPVSVAVNAGTAVGLQANAPTSAVEFAGGLTVVAGGAARGVHGVDGGTIVGTLTSVTSQTGIAVDLAGTSVGAAGLSILGLVAGSTSGGPVHALRLVDVGGSGGVVVEAATVRRTTDDAVRLERVTLPAVELRGLGVVLDACAVGAACVPMA